MSESISVQTSTNSSYELYFGSDLSSEMERYLQSLTASKAFVLVDAFVLKHHETRFKEVLESCFEEIHVLEVPRGEGAKSLEFYQKALDFILGKGVERSTPLLAIGGGVTGDVAGFVAATVLRGVPLIHVPTTLLAMVDSSIGGKTGVNHSVGKNLIGSFYQPSAVFADVDYLKTLPEKEWVNGLSEVLKYGMIQEPGILDEVNSLIDEDLFMDGKAWLPLIQKSAQIKVDVVAEDVLEAGKRAYLNFGHTFAHVIEREGNYEKYSHGEAVYAGMIAALEASSTLGADLSVSNLLRFKPLYDLSLKEISASPDVLVEMMRFDKKVKNEQIKLVLLKEPGHPYIFTVKDPQIVEQAWMHTLKIFE